MKKLPILDQKFHDRPSVFQPENLLREARRQKGITELTIRDFCILDPDGDIVEFVLKNHQGQVNKAWACYHTDLVEFTYEGIKFGIIGKAVGASFAVLLHVGTIFSTQRHPSQWSRRCSVVSAFRYSIWCLH